jgi:hypothetical protein
VVVDVVVLLEWLKQTMAQTMMAVAAAPPMTQALLAKNVACCSPAAGPGGNGWPGGTGAGAGASAAAPAEVLPPEAPAPPLCPDRMGTGWALGWVVSWATDAVSVAPKKTAAVMVEMSDLDMANLTPKRPLRIIA